MTTVLELEAPADVHAPVELPAALSIPTEFRPIAAFLAQHPGLLEVLNTGLQRLHHAFPESRGFLLTLEADPEIVGWEYLVAAVKTSLPAATAHERLTTAFDPWWIEHLAQFGDVLLFDVEYV